MAFPCFTNSLLINYCVKHVKTRAFFCPTLPVYGQNRIRFFSYLDKIPDSVQNTRKYGSEKACILTYLTQ